MKSLRRKMRALSRAQSSIGCQTMLHRRAKQRATAERSQAAVTATRCSPRGRAGENFKAGVRGLVIANWEDPAVDLAACRFRPTDQVRAIGSADATSQLSGRRPARSPRSISTGSTSRFFGLKCARRHLPDSDALLSLIGPCDCRGNLVAYDQTLKPHLDLARRRYGKPDTIHGPARIESFTRNFYRYGCSAAALGMGHLLRGSMAAIPRHPPHPTQCAGELDASSALFRRERWRRSSNKRFVRCWVNQRPRSRARIALQHRSGRGKTRRMARVCNPGRAARLPPDLPPPARNTCSKALRATPTTPGPSPAAALSGAVPIRDIKSGASASALPRLHDRVSQRHAMASIDCLGCGRPGLDDQQRPSRCCGRE